MTDFSITSVPNISNISFSFPDSCAQSRIPTLSWQTDAEMPYDYQVRFCSDADCMGGPLVATEVLGTNSTSWTPACSTCCDVAPYNNIEFGGNNYYGQVRARNLDGEWSGWAKINFSTYNNCHPEIDFSWDPLSPSAGTVVQFTDESICYDAAGSGVPCASWSWDFESGDPLSSNLQNPTTTFTVIELGGNETTLQVCDDNPYCCPGTDYVNVTPPLPEYREVPPIIWLKKALAAVIDFFNGMFQ